MLRSKSRSASVDFGQKNHHHSSVFSKTLSASKLCRGDALISQIDSNALKSVDKKPPKVSNSENRINRVLQMQQHMGQLEEELQRTKDQLSIAEFERDEALDELRETKEEAQEANMRYNEALSPNKAKELISELKALKESVSKSQEELRKRDMNIESLRSELEKAKRFELALVERDASLDRLKEEFRNTKESETKTLDLLSESKKEIKELEAEVETAKASEKNLVDSLAMQTKKLEEIKIELEESKLEIASIRGRVSSPRQNIRDVEEWSNRGGSHSNEKEIESLKSELRLTKGNLAQAREAENEASIKYKNLCQEMEVLKNELKLAIEAEEKSTKARDDLALALKEVATEANLTKEKLMHSQMVLEQVKGEPGKLKEIVQTTEERYQKLLEEAKKEAELYKNTADRLRLEAEESLLAWNGKEMGFVSCIKRAEEEKAHVQHENAKLTEAHKAAEHSTLVAREEIFKLRDILKQAVNEANAAKAAAGIAQDENSQLKDCLAEKDEALDFLTRENERLRINEAAARENIKELKRLLSAPPQEVKHEEKEQNRILKSSDSEEEDEIEDEEEVEPEERERSKTFSFDFDELKFMDAEDEAEVKIVTDEDPEKAEALKGSIFDSVDSPRSEPHTPKPAPSHRRVYSTTFVEDAVAPNPEDLEHLEAHCDDSDSDRNSHRRRRGALFRRVGDLLMRKSFHRKEPSTEAVVVKQT